MLLRSKPLLIAQNHSTHLRTVIMSKKPFLKIGVWGTKGG